ncbi:MAG: MurR/RpiR family transcriptional regulator [Eubacteriales bacterium]
MEQDNIITRINSQFSKMSKSHKAIATYISDHYHEAVFMTAAKLGEAVHVSESTVVRFATGIGYEGYPEFQDDLEVWVKSQLSSVQRIRLKYGSSTQSELLTSVLTGDMDKIQDTLMMLDPNMFETAIANIIQAKSVYVIGIRSCEPLANFLSFYLNMIRGNIHLLTTTNTSEVFEQMIRVNSEDVVIGISFPRYSLRTLRALEFANDRTAKIITITDTVNSPMCMYSSCNLLARSDMVSIVDSLVAPLSVINALVVGLCLKCSDEVKSNLEVLEEVWNNYQIDSKDELNYMNKEPILDYPGIGTENG